MPDIMAADLDTATVKDIEKWVIVNVLDKCNMTAERFEKLRCLVRQRDEEARSKAVDPENVSRSSTWPPTPSPDEMAVKDRVEAYENYNCLIQMGGRPSAPIQEDPGIWDPSVMDEQMHVPWHWGEEANRCEQELQRWKTFRKYQQSKRRSAEVFTEYKATIHNYLVQKDIPWGLTLESDIEGQSKVDEWKEYYLHVHTGWDSGEKKVRYLAQNIGRHGISDWDVHWLRKRLDVKIHLLEWILGQLPYIVAEFSKETESNNWSSRPTSPRTPRRNTLHKTRAKTAPRKRLSNPCKVVKQRSTKSKAGSSSTPFHTSRPSLREPLRVEAGGKSSSLRRSARIREKMENAGFTLGGSW
ncbi:hypothetical protein MMC30_007185 [Trapelia coarctata]|nr:hypothetical protein [Trapelia coarctata]